MYKMYIPSIRLLIAVWV